MKLYTAVIQEMNRLNKFSAYDITKSLRDKVNNNTILIEDVKLVSGGGNKPNYLNIAHDAVNDIIKDIYTTQIITLNRTQGSGYYMYELYHNVPLVSVTKTQYRTQNIPIASIKVLNGFSKTERHQIYTKVASYVSNKRKNKESITFKGINSALKTKGVTVKDIGDICNKLGYKVVQKTPTHASEVK